MQMLRTSSANWQLQSKLHSGGQVTSKQHRFAVMHSTQFRGEEDAADAHSNEGTR